jgi:hypothetical protein
MMATSQWPVGAEVVELGDRAELYIRDYLGSCGVLSRAMLGLPIGSATSYVVLPEGFDERSAAAQLLGPRDRNGDDLVEMLRYGGWSPAQRASMTTFVATVTADDLGVSGRRCAIFEDPFSSPSDGLSDWGVDWLSLGDSVYFVVPHGKHSIDLITRVIHLPIFFRSVWAILDLDRVAGANPIATGSPGRSLDESLVSRLMPGVRRVFMKVFDQEGCLIVDLSTLGAIGRTAGNAR